MSGASALISKPQLWKERTAGLFGEFYGHCMSSA